MRFYSERGRGEELELEVGVDGVLTSGGEAVGAIRGRQVVDQKGIPVAIVEETGKVFVPGGLPMRFEGEALLTQEGGRLTIGPDGGLTLVTGMGDLVRLGRFDGVAGATRTGLLLGYLMIARRAPQAPPPATREPNPSEEEEDDDAFGAEEGEEGGVTSGQRGGVEGGFEGAPPPPPMPMRTIPPAELEARRISGSTSIPLSAAIAEELRRAGQTAARASVRLCVDVSGRVDSARLEVPSGLREYDRAALAEAARGRYRPFGGRVCSEVVVRSAR